MIEHKEDKIKMLEDHDCLKYVKEQMPKECLEEYELMTLMDWLHELLTYVINFIKNKIISTNKQVIFDIWKI